MSTTEALIEPTPVELAAARRYSLVMQWSDEDRAYIVTVPELEGCRTHGQTRAEAARQAEDAIVTWLVAARVWGERIPVPRLFPDAGDHADRARSSSAMVADREAR